MKISNKQITMSIDNDYVLAGDFDILDKREVEKIKQSFCNFVDEYVSDKMKCQGYDFSLYVGDVVKISDSSIGTITNIGTKYWSDEMEYTIMFSDGSVAKFKEKDFEKIFTDHTVYISKALRDITNTLKSIEKTET